MIEVERTATIPDGWAFVVRVSDDEGQTEHQVTLARADWQRLTGQAVQPEALLERTFEFLLRHESKEGILRQFDLMVVARYFPDFEADLKRALRP